MHKGREGQGEGEGGGEGGRERGGGEEGDAADAACNTASNTACARVLSWWEMPGSVAMAGNTSVPGARRRPVQACWRHMWPEGR